MRGARPAATAGRRAVVPCAVDAVWLGTRGGLDGIASAGLPVLADLFAQFTSRGGEVWLCGACTKLRGIGEDVVAAGARIVGVAKVIEEVTAGAKTVAFA